MTVKYTKEHEWIRIDGDTATIGISEYAQEQLGEIVFVELPEAGTPLEKGSEAAVIESVKAASEVYAPASGRAIPFASKRGCVFTAMTSTRRRPRSRRACPGSSARAAERKAGFPAPGSFSIN